MTDQKTPYRLVRQSFRPLLFSYLLRNRKIALLLLGIALLQLGLVSGALVGWQCPVQTTLGIPCPGCGLSKAIIALVRGEWRAALFEHAFAPVFLLGYILMMAVVALPGRQYRLVVRWVAVIERRTGLVLCVLLGLVVYWLVRLVGSLTHT
jgi:hypothetical protein